MRLELLMPNQVEVDDFLRRFLDRSGPGPHHFTFKVADIEAALAEAEAEGLRPVGVNLRDPEWKEAFLHPKDAALGIVVQLAQSSGSEWRPPPPPDGYPAAAEHARPADLVRIVHCVADLDHALARFRDLLGGTEVDRGDDEAATWVELAWPGPGRIRLCRPRAGRGPLAEWLDGRPGRVHHLAFAHADLARVEDARPLAGGGAEAGPDDVTGTRVVLLPGS
jgi:catechol 2,3-dioxygenase-like lactoylglutathione lyase family enzyme